MGLLARLFGVVRAKLRRLLRRSVEAVESPDQVFDDAIADMTGEVASFRKKVAAALVDGKRLAADAAGAENELREWQSRAEAAVRAGDDETARSALGRAAEAERARDGRRAPLVEHERETAALKDTLRALTQRLDDTRRRRNLLVARADSARTRQRIADTLTDELGEDRFAAIESRVTELELEVELATETAEIGHSGDSFGYTPSTDSGVEESLRELKARIAGSSTEPGAEPPPPSSSSEERE